MYRVELDPSDDDLGSTSTHAHGAASMARSRSAPQRRELQHLGASPKQIPRASTPRNTSSSSVVTEGASSMATFGAAHRARGDLGEICCVGGVHRGLPANVLDRLPLVSIVFGDTYGAMEWFEDEHDDRAAYLYAAMLRTSVVTESPLPFLASRLGFCSHMRLLWQSLYDERRWPTLIASVRFGRSQAGFDQLVVAHVLALRGDTVADNWGVWSMLSNKIVDHEIRVLAFSSPFGESLFRCVEQFAQGLIACDIEVHVPMHNDDWTFVLLVLGPCSGFRGMMSSAFAEFADLPPIHRRWRQRAAQQRAAEEFGGLSQMPPIHCKLVANTLVSIWIKGGIRRSSRGLAYQVASRTARDMEAQMRREQQQPPRTQDHGGASSSSHR